MLDQRAAPSSPVLGLTTILTVTALGITITGVVTSHAMFHMAGLNYADYASVSDALTAGLRYPVATLFGVATGLVVTLLAWLSLRQMRLQDRVKSAIILTVVSAMYIASSAMIMIASPAGTLVNKKHSFWREYLLGRSPRIMIDVDLETGPVKDRLSKAKEIRQLAASSDYFLFSLDDQPLAIRKDLVKGIWPVASQKSGRALDELGHFHFNSQSAAPAAAAPRCRAARPVR